MLNRSSRLMIFIILIQIGFSLYLQSHITRFEDGLTYVSEAQRIIDGSVLYKDIIVPNFPIVIYQQIPCVLLSRWLDINIISVTELCDNAVASLSLFCTIYIWRRAFPANLLGPCITAGVFFILPYYDNIMGEQDYYYFIYSLPYFALSAARAQNVTFSRLFSYGIGAVSVLGFGIKPVFALPLLLVEALMCYRCKTCKTLLRPEALACIGAGMIYLAWIAIALPDFFRAIAPLWRFYYAWHLGFWPSARYFAGHLCPLVIPAYALWAYMLLKKTSTFSMDICYAALSGNIMEAVIQLKSNGWDYHLFPALGMSLISISLFSTHACQSKRFVKMITASALGAMIGYCAFIVDAGVIKHEKNQDKKQLALSHMLDMIPPGELRTHGIYIFGNLLTPVFPAGYAQYHLPWNYHFYDQWVLQGVSVYKKSHVSMSAREKSQIATIKQWLRQTLTDDLKHNDPSLILISSKPGGWRYLKFYSAYAPFADFMKNYTFKESAYGYNIYVRNK